MIFNLPSWHIRWMTVSWIRSKSSNVPKCRRWVSVGWLSIFQNRVPFSLLSIPTVKISTPEFWHVWMASGETTSFCEIPLARTIPKCLTPDLDPRRRRNMAWHICFKALARLGLPLKCLMRSIFDLTIFWSRDLKKWSWTRVFSPKDIMPTRT